MPAHIGGSFAPPLDDAKLARYQDLAANASAQIKDLMTKLIEMLKVFRQTPKSTLPAVKHPSGRGLIVPLDAVEIERIWAHVPWAEELTMYGQVFDQIDPVIDKEVRDAAFHLLWFGRELCLDREPTTNDLL